MIACYDCCVGLDDIADRNRKGLRILYGGGVGGAVGFMVAGILGCVCGGVVGVAGATLAGAFSGSDPAHVRRTNLIALASIAVVVALAAGAYALWPRGGAPGGTVNTRTGEAIELATLWRDHRVAVFFYPGKGCDSCTYILEEIEAHRKDLDADVIAISAHGAGRAQALHERMKLGFEIYVDPKFMVIPKWGVPFITADATAAALFIVEPGGKISFKQIGSYPSWDQLVALTHAKS